MSLVLVTPPSGEPVDIADLKTQLRVDATSDDTMLTGLLKVAREWAEGFANIKCLAQTWDYSLTGFPRCITLPFAPVSSVVSVKYVDLSGAVQTLDTSIYSSFLAAAIPHIDRQFGKWWPIPLPVSDNVIVRFVAGYATASLIDERIKLAIKIYAEAIYDRDPVNADKLKTMAENLLAPLRTMTF